MVDISTVKQTENNRRHYITRFVGIGIAHSIVKGIQTITDAISFLRQENESKENKDLIVNYALQTFTAEGKPELAREFFMSWLDGEGSSSARLSNI